MTQLLGFLLHRKTPSTSASKPSNRSFALLFLGLWLGLVFSCQPPQGPGVEAQTEARQDGGFQKEAPRPEPAKEAPVGSEMPAFESVKEAAEGGGFEAVGEAEKPAGEEESQSRDATEGPVADEGQAVDEGRTADEGHPEESLPERSPEAPKDAATTEGPPPEPRPACIGAKGEDLCDDGDDCNGRESCDRQTGRCRSPSPPACPSAPPECNQTGGQTSHQAGRFLAATPREGFRLRDLEQWSAQEALVAQIAAHPSVTKRSLNDLLLDLNRTASKVTSIPGLSCLQSGFAWDAGDAAVASWYPQGISGSATATSDGLYQGKSILVASWYHKPDEDPDSSVNKGARISFVDITSSASLRYRHALLVEPILRGGQADFQPVPIHAGGLVWVKNYLYVPDTSKGFRVFDLSRILEVKTTDKTLGGYVASRQEFHAYSYKYVVPQVNLYTRCPGSCCARFSFASLHVASQPAALLSGEYTSADESGRLHQWPLDLTTGRLVTARKTVIASAVFFSGVRKMQGATMQGSTFWISSSQPKATSPTSPGSLARGVLSQPITTFRYPYPPEDMHDSPFSKEIWSQTENPGQRFVFSILPSRLGTSCP